MAKQTKEERRIKFVLIILAYMMLALTFWRLYILNTFNDKSVELYNIEQEIDSLHKENTLLKAQLLREESLTEIDQKARDRGFVPATYMLLK